MNKNIFISGSLLLISSFVLSACGPTDSVKSEILDKVIQVKNEVNTKIDQKVADEQTEQTDEQLLKELDSSDTSIDTDFKALETELQ